MHLSLAVSWNQPLIFIRSGGSEALEKRFLEVTRIILLDNLMLFKDENVVEALNIGFLSIFHPIE